MSYSWRSVTAVEKEKAFNRLLLVWGIQRQGAALFFGVKVSVRHWIVMKSGIVCAGQKTNGWKYWKKFWGFFHSKTPLAKGDTPVKEPAHGRGSCRNCKQKLREHKRESCQRRHTADTRRVFHFNPEIVQKGNRRQKICLMETRQFPKKTLPYSQVFNAWISWYFRNILWNCRKKKNFSAFRQWVTWHGAISAGRGGDWVIFKYFKRGGKKSLRY